MSLDPYPTEEEVARIKEWPHEDLRGLMEFVRSLWWPDQKIPQDGNTYRLATGGWSGNEDIVSALRSNMMFWVLCWESSRRGGLHIFTLPSNKNSPAESAD